MNVLKRISPFARFVVFINAVIILLSLTNVIKPPPKSVYNDYVSSLAAILPDTVEWDHFKDRLDLPSHDRFSRIWITLAGPRTDSTVLIMLSDHAVRIFSFDSLSAQYPYWDPLPLRTVYLYHDRLRIHDSDFTDCQLVFPELFFIHPEKGRIVSLNLETFKRDLFKGKPFKIFNPASRTVVIREPDSYVFYRLNDYPSGKNPVIRIPADPLKTLSFGQNAVVFSDDGCYVALAHTIPAGQQGLYAYDSTQLKLIYSFDCIDCEQVFISPHGNRLLIRDKGTDFYRFYAYAPESGQFGNRHQLKPGAFIGSCDWYESGDVFLIKTANGRQLVAVSTDKITLVSSDDYPWMDAVDGSFSSRFLYLLRNIETTADYNPILGRHMKQNQTLIYRMPLP